MGVFAERVFETSVSSGTGAMSLDGAVADFEAFGDRFSDGDFVFYAIVQSGAGWEVGLGKYVSGTDSLSRDTVLQSSNADTLVNFGSGTKNVFATPSAAAMGGAWGAVSPETASRALTLADHGKLLEVDTSAAAVTLTLPALSSMPPGSLFNVKLATDGNLLTVDGNGSELIEGQLTQLLGLAGQFLVIRKNVSGWHIVGEGREITDYRAAIATTSGASHDVEDIRPTARRLSLLFDGVSTSTTTSPNVQIGPAAGVETTGYKGTVSQVANAGSTISTLLPIFDGGWASGRTVYGTVELDLADRANNAWSLQGDMASGDSARVHLGAGFKQLGGRLAIARLNAGAGNFDAGSVSPVIEYGPA